MNSTPTIPFSAATNCGTTEAFKPEVHESTYGLLVRSEEKTRGIFEAAAYLLCILSAIMSICQFARQPITVPVSVGHGATYGSISTGIAIVPARS